MSLETSWENTPASAGHKTSMSDGYDFSALRILVVDDSFHMRELVRTFLEGFGIKEVTVSSDAEEAYDIVVGTDPDLII
ncbi:MAG: response regulator, partial [Rhodospirillaceae bacterium]